MPSRRRNAAPVAEQAMIRAIAAQAAGSPAGRGGVRLGIGDDCAVLRPRAGHEVVVTTDLLLETVHFRRDWHTPESVGHRCLARGLSDLAAMGALPLAAFLSIAIPEDLKTDWLHRFMRGLLRLAGAHHVPLAGGDTAAAPGGPDALFSADIVLLGSVPAGRAVLRSGARPGDRLYVTGALGGSAAELAQLEAGVPRRLRSLRRLAGGAGHPQLFPQPRLVAGARLRRSASAAIDVSDGLSTDLEHLCIASGITACLDEARIPVHRLAAQTSDPLSLALHGGEDYELLFTAARRVRIPPVVDGTPVTCIGEITRRGPAPVVLLAPDGTRRPLVRAGWEHFRSRRPAHEQQA